MKFLLPLLAAAILTLAASLTTASPLGGDAALPSLPLRASDRRAPALRRAPAARHAPAALCEHPGHLRLHRFEDRSARLECAGQVLLRISVPG